VAAKNLGRRYLGFDIGEEYVAVARKRLQPDMFEIARVPVIDSRAALQK
jgi:DNA modification methylase